MSLIVTTPPQHSLLVDVPQLRRELGASETADAVLAEQARQVSSVIRTYCQQEFSRTIVQESLPPTYGPLMLTRTPVMSVLTVTQDGSPIVDAVIEDARAGLLSRPSSVLGWGWSAWGQGTWWPASARSEFGLGNVLLASMSVPSVVVDYVAGYLLPEDDVVSPLVAVNGPAKTLTLSAGRFPLLVLGDRIEASGFTTAANNATWTVLTRTDTVVTVVETGLVTELETASGGNPKTLRVRTLPDDVVRAALDVLKSWYLARARDPVVTSRSISGLSITYGGIGSPTGPLALPPTAAALLAPYRRLV